MDFILILTTLSLIITAFNLSSFKKLKWIFIYSFIPALFCYFSFSFAMNLNFIKLKSLVLSSHFIKIYCILLIIEAVLFIIANYALIFRHFINEQRSKWIEKFIFIPSINFFLSLFLVQVFLLNHLNGIHSFTFKISFGILVFIITVFLSILIRLISSSSWERKSKKRILLYTIQLLFAMFLPQFLEKAPVLESNFSIHFNIYLISFAFIVVFIGLGYVYANYLRRKK